MINKYLAPESQYIYWTLRLDTSNSQTGYLCYNYHILTLPSYEADANIDVPLLLRGHYLIQLTI